MAKQIVWSLRARSDLLNILEYWVERNKSTVYPRKLFTLINVTISKLSNNVVPRRSTEFPGVNVKILRDYKIYFKEDEDTIYIITIWDTRQNPGKLKRIIK